MKRKINRINHIVEDEPIVVLNLIYDDKKATSVWKFAKRKYDFTMMDYYRIPLAKNKNIEDILNSDLKYMNVNFLYLVDNKNRLHLGNGWNEQRLFKQDRIIDESLKLYIC